MKPEEVGEGGRLVYSRNGLQILKLDQDANHIQVCKFKVFNVSCYLVYRPPNARNDSVTELADTVRNVGEGLHTHGRLQSTGD